ncbi:hypothetical protein AV530_002204 [Patagioenas fasciata monilis]|uniref:Uncharacterized protein n=1 Tax=Patagioenas fasciata monilis TaxID=372326 RepID=A0A1V4K5I6_PATFA|nr:hypothetical protein AV530_002204 [Patagioenas fasciata monilis]
MVLESYNLLGKAHHGSQSELNVSLWLRKKSFTFQKPDVLDQIPLDTGCMLPFSKSSYQKMPFSRSVKRTWLRILQQRWSKVDDVIWTPGIGKTEEKRFGTEVRPTCLKRHVKLCYVLGEIGWEEVYLRHRIILY